MRAPVYGVSRTVLIFGLLVTGCGGDPIVRRQGHFEQGNQYFDRGKFSEAVVEYRNARR